MSLQNDMIYTRLGQSGLKVSKLILGCASYGNNKQHKWRVPEEEALQHIKAAYDLGINTFDTSDIYANGESEIILGKAIKKHNLPRDEIVVITKGRAPVGRDPADNLSAVSPQELDQKRYTNQYGLSRKHLFAAINASLARLQLEYVDVYMCHRFDYDTPIEETMTALHDIVTAGYARYIGMSSCYAWQFHKMQNFARSHGLTRFIVMEGLYNPVYREEEREMMPLTMDLGVGYIPYSPNAGGGLSKPLDATSQRKETDRHAAALQNAPFFPEVNQKIASIAEARGISMTQVALAWSIAKPHICAPIVGATSIEKLKDSCGAVRVKLTEEEIRAIDDPYQPRAVIGPV